MRSGGVVVCERGESWQEDLLRRRLRDVDLPLRFFDETAGELPGEVRESARFLSVFIGSSLTKRELEQWPRLEGIATRSTGFDHIDRSYCEQNGIVLCNVPTYGDNTVAEHTFALILSLSRHLHEVVQRTRRGDFQMGGMRGFDLRGKTLGVIGTGHIGIHVVKTARGFGMNVLAHDPRQDNFMAELMSFEYVPLERLLEESHIVTLHVPLNEQTHHMIDREQIRRCREGALLINTARGGLINTDALYEALEEGRLGGAGLDVLEGEQMLLSEIKLSEKEFSREKLKQLVQNNQLLQRDDVVFTPHMAYNSREAVERILHTTADNLRGLIRGDPVHVVKEDTGRPR